MTLSRDPASRRPGLRRLLATGRLFSYSLEARNMLRAERYLGVHVETMNGVHEPRLPLSMAFAWVPVRIAGVLCPLLHRPDRGGKARRSAAARGRSGAGLYLELASIYRK